MLIYICVILGSSLFLYISDRMRIYNNVLFSYLFMIIGILTISIFAGLRNLNVGIDINVYGKGIFEVISERGIKEAIYLYSRWADRGYIFFNYFISLFTRNIHVYLGVLCFFTQVNFYLFYRKYSNLILTSFSMMILNFLVLGLSFNLLRQIAATSVVVWFFYFLSNKRYILSIVFFLLSISIHRSSVLVLLLLLLLFLYSLLKEKISQKYLLMIVVAMTFVLGYLINKYPEWIDLISSDLDLANIQQSNYGSVPRLLIFIIPIVFFRIINKESFIQNNFDYYLYLLCLLVISFSWISGINYTISRFTSYLYPFYVLFVSRQAKISNKIFWYFLIVLWAILAFWWLIVRTNVGGILPYTPYWEDYIIKIKLI